ncbi:LLM class flavin-dependent oxidoreductase [Candidatus Bathyarchaeota archaeon]|nr:LLM class flavin-dependent oxidoreductase [Candidatus Bathyarchaeota archaeon]
MPRPEIQINLGENDYDPYTFVEAAVYCEQMGFRTVWFGDHLFPWFHSGKRSSYVWPMLSVALEKTSGLKVGPWVTVPIGARYHPAIVAQAAATIDNMYPGRLLLAVGSGEALNERPFWNGRWPRWGERMDRLVVGVRLMRMLWDSKEPFSFDGQYFKADFYYLYTKPKRKIPVYFSAIGRKAAARAGEVGDGLVTICPRNNIQAMKEVILPAYREGRLRTGKNGLGEVAIELNYSFKTPEEIARTEWRSLGINRKDSWSIPNPVAVEEEGKKFPIDDIPRNIHLCTGWKDVVSLIEEYSSIGVSAFSLFTGADKRQIRSIADNVLKVF